MALACCRLGGLDRSVSRSIGVQFCLQIAPLRAIGAGALGGNLEKTRGAGLEIGAGLKNAWSNCGLTVVDLAFGRVRVMFPSPTAHPGYHVSVSTSEGIAHVLARGTRGFELHFQSSEGVTIEPTEVTFEIVGFVDGDLA